MIEYNCPDISSNKSREALISGQLEENLKLLWSSFSLMYSFSKDVSIYLSASIWWPVFVFKTYLSHHWTYHRTNYIVQNCSYYWYGLEISEVHSHYSNKKSTNDSERNCYVLKFKLHNLFLIRSFASVVIQNI